MNHPKKYTAAESEKIRTEFLSGKSYKAISKKTGRTYGSEKSHVATNFPDLIKPRPYFKMKDDRRKVERNHPRSYSVEEALAIGYKLAGVMDLLYNP